MKNPNPVNLQTPEEIRALGWLAEARDSDGHVMTVISPQASDETLGEFMRECTAEGWTVTAWPRVQPTAANLGAPTQGDSRAADPLPPADNSEGK